MWPVDQAGGRRGVLAADLDEAGSERGEERDEEAHGHAGEERDAPVEAGEAAGCGDEEAVVEDDGGEHGELGEDAH